MSTTPGFSDEDKRMVLAAPVQKTLTAHVRLLSPQKLRVYVLLEWFQRLKHLDSINLNVAPRFAQVSSDVSKARVSYEDFAYELYVAPIMTQHWNISRLSLLKTQCDTDWLPRQFLT